MKKFVSIAGIATAVLALGFLTTLLAEAPAEEQTTTTAFQVEGMTCGGCEVAVRAAVKKLDGVASVKASHKEGSAEVTYDSEKVTPKAIIAAIEKIGFQAELKEEEES